MIDPGKEFPEPGGARALQGAAPFTQTNMMPFVAAAVFYYIFNLVVAVAMEWIEKKLDYYR